MIWRDGRRNYLHCVRMIHNASRTPLRRPRNGFCCSRYQTWMMDNEQSMAISIQVGCSNRIALLPRRQPIILICYGCLAHNAWCPVERFTPNLPAHTSSPTNCKKRRWQNHTKDQRLTQLSDVPKAFASWTPPLLGKELFRSVWFIS